MGQVCRSSSESLKVSFATFQIFQFYFDPHLQRNLKFNFRQIQTPIDNIPWTLFSVAFLCDCLLYLDISPPRQTNAGQYVTRGRQCTTAPLPLCKDLHGNTQTRVKYKSKHTQIHEHKSPKNIKKCAQQHKSVMLGEMPGRCWGFALYKEAISSDPSVAGQDLLYLPTNYLWTHSGRRMLDYWLIFSGILLTNRNGGIFLFNLNCQILDDNSLLP